MRLILKLVIVVLFVFSYKASNAQWLRKSESSEELYKEARREAEQKHYQRAINLCLRALDLTPNNLDIHLLLGKNYGFAGKTDSALIELDYVMEKDPKYKDAHLCIINIEVIACNYQQAMEYVDRGLKQFPGDRDILLKKLFIYEKQEGLDQRSNRMAEYLFERFPQRIIILRSVYIDFKLMLAREYAHRGYLEIAKRAYEAVLDQDPMNSRKRWKRSMPLMCDQVTMRTPLAYTNRALQASPSSYEFLLKKVAILEAMSLRYPESGIRGDTEITGSWCTHGK